MKRFVTAACALCGALGSQGLPEGRKSRPRTDAREKGSKTKAYCGEAGVEGWLSSRLFGSCCISWGSPKISHLALSDAMHNNNVYSSGESLVRQSVPTQGSVMYGSEPSLRETKGPRGPSTPPFISLELNDILQCF